MLRLRIYLRNRQYIREAIALAAAGKVSCFHTVRGLSELETCVVAIVTVNSLF